MAARKYEISLRVLKNIFSTRVEKFRISKRPCNVLFIIQTPMKYQTISLRPRPHVSGNFCIRKFVYADTTSVHTCSPYTLEISVYALQSGNFCMRCVSGYVWTLVSVYFLYTLTSQYQNQSFCACSVD